MLCELWYNLIDGASSKAFSYNYTSKGEIAEVINHLSDRTTVYTYDSGGRLSYTATYNTSDGDADLKEICSYNDKGELRSVYHDVYYPYREGFDHHIIEYDYFYTDDGKLERIESDGEFLGVTSRYIYDGINRVIQKQISFTTGYAIVTDIGYEPGTNRINSYTRYAHPELPLTYTYTYDGDGNITKIRYITGLDTYTVEEVGYTYDGLGQLIREDNGLLGETYVYTYDEAGNITSKSVYPLTAEGVTPTNPISTKNYGYSDSAWGDLLTSYNGQSITYDEIGNPLTYYNGASFTWQGRRLSTATLNGNNYSFEYDDNGLRIAKSVGNSRTDYYYSGDKLIAEVCGETVLVYIYDDAGAPVGYLYRNSAYPDDFWDSYVFDKNLHGDIVGVYAPNSAKLVSYEYDAWGNCTVIYHGNGASTGAAANPFRYRGYYYDTDLGLYYLGSRYYDANTGRFINVDAYVQTPNGDMTSSNMFAYCGNNPVNRKDPTGQFWGELVEILKTAALEIGKAMGVVSPAYAAAGGAALADGPLPIGDIIALAAVTFLTAGVIGQGITKDLLLKQTWVLDCLVVDLFLG